MSEQSSLLEEALEAWDDTRRGVIAEAANIPAEQYGFRPAPDTRNVAELLRHIMEVSMMMVAELALPETNMRRAPFQELLEPHSRELESIDGKDALVRALHSTLETGLAELRRCGELHMLQYLTRFDGQRGTRLAWFHHGISQEMYHRGQLATYQRLMSLEPALTKRIRGG